MTKYRTIVADPPWHHERTGVTFTAAEGGEFESHGTPYDSMSVDEIKALPVKGLATNVDEDAHLYLWTTSRYLRDAFDVARGWGFHYAATLVWCKPSRGFGMGGVFQNNVEFVLFCKRPKLTTRDEAVKVTTWLRGEAARAGVTEADINDHMGTRRMAMWWISKNPRMASVPTWEKWEQLRELIGFGAEMDEAVHELNAVKGTKRKETRQVVPGRWFEWPRSAHSVKPEAFFDLVEQVSPGPYLEMFARRARFGWDYWGDESLGTAELPGEAA